MTYNVSSGTLNSTIPFPEKAGYRSKIGILFHTPPLFDTEVKHSASAFYMQKIELRGYQKVKKSEDMFTYFDKYTNVTDRWTYGQHDIA